MDNDNQIVIYQTGDSSSPIEVHVKDETVWLNRNQLAALFDRDIKTIGKHITNVFREGELKKDATVAKFATVQIEGNREIEYYNSDLIIENESDGSKSISDNTLVALTLMLAESNPSDKDLMIKIVVNLLVNHE